MVTGLPIRTRSQRAGRRVLAAGLVLASLGLVACEAEDPCADGPMSESEAGLFLTEAEHGDAWGESQCFGCHVEAVLHSTGCTPDVWVGAIDEQVADEGLDSCQSCHGDNGVPR